MTDIIHKPTAEFTAKSHANSKKYAEMYAASINDTETFWGTQGKRLD